MADLLPWLFVIVATVAIIAGLVSLWLSLSLALSDEALGGVRELNEKLRAEARQVLHALDAGAESFRDEAEALIAERLAAKS
ncbi:MAG: hypothetical protein JRF48_06505 [Deltaproteobacteria bacterium]|nr:hypothetical protein [Deltaproteobacteria bacterium]